MTAGTFPGKRGGAKALWEKSQKWIQGEFGGHKERKAMCSAVTLTDTSDETETSATPVLYVSGCCCSRCLGYLTPNVWMGEGPAQSKKQDGGLHIKAVQHRISGSLHRKWGHRIMLSKSHFLHL